MTLTVTSKLDAVNTMLRSIGETPINTLEDPRSSDVLIAIDVLDDVTREVQLLGWSFNRDYEFPLIPSGLTPFDITVPTNALSIVPSECEASRNITVRGDKVYDREGHTFRFPDTTSIKFDIIWLFEFAVMPETMRRFVTIHAARRFQDDVVGDESQHSFKAQDEERARRAMYREERRNTPLNFLSNASSRNILRRHPRLS